MHIGAKNTPQTFLPLEGITYIGEHLFRNKELAGNISNSKCTLVIAFLIVT